MKSKLRPELVSLIQKEIGHLPSFQVQEFIKSLSPTQKTDVKLYQSFFKTIVSQYQSRMSYSSGIKMEGVTSHIIAMANQVNQRLSVHIKKMMENQLFLGPIKRVAQKYQPKQAIQSSLRQSKRKSGRSPGLESETVNQASHSSEECHNLENKPQCICKKKKQILIKDQFSFFCCHCQRLFHTVCFKKRHNSQACSYCYLEKMIPTKKVIQTVFLGLLHKNIQQHSATFVAPELEKDQKLQVRCLRVKDGTQSSCLFPDSTVILINSNWVVKLQPMSKQSCLKYRKDQPFVLKKGDYFPDQENTLLIDETVSRSRKSELRCESQSHIFAIYVIESLKIQVLMNNLKTQSVLGFSQSKAMLTESFKMGKGDDDLTCQIVKTPLSCPLSSVRIQIPARGIFCTHLQCFDLKTYLVLISQSQNPRWKCPLCGNLAYELCIDSITLQILNENKEDKRIQQMLFFKNGDYAPIVDNQPMSQRKKNISDLSIPQKKPKHPLPAVKETALQESFVVPANAEVIDLDD